MHTIYDSVRDGTRLDIEVELLAKQTITVSGEELERMLVIDSEGAEFHLMRAQVSETTPDVEPVSTLRVSGMLGADPVTQQGSTEKTCPECNGALRRGQAIDAVNPVYQEAFTRFDLERTVGIVDESASIIRVQEDQGLVDDWRPMGGERRLTTPEYVCMNCGANVAAHELRNARHSEAAEDKEPLESTVANQPSPAADATMGLAAGGAKDLNNFRDNIENGYTPQPEAITDEGLFYDYYFETGDGQATDALFSPRYATAVTEHPLSGDTEQYLSVGLDSTLSVAEFERPTLDLVVVLDISGSMSNRFDSYYYDEHGNKRTVDGGVETKIEAATQSLCALTTHLNDDDHFGVILFNSQAHIAKPLRDVRSTDMDAIRAHIREIQSGGGTNMADGFETAVDMLAETHPEDDVEQRVVFMTDMMPNTGQTGRSDLTQLFEAAADDGIHTTFVGMGLDTNAELAEELSGIRGANQYFVHSANEFEQRLDDEFTYMVTPLVYDLDLELRTEGFEIESVHGSPANNPTEGQLMHVGTLFPSAKEDGKARGGVILVRLTRDRQDGELELVASWTDREGTEHMEEVAANLPEEGEFYDHDGIRKAIALTRYARVLRDWSRNVHDHSTDNGVVDDWMWNDTQSEHERDSTPLTVPEDFLASFEALREYLEAEMEAVGDTDFQQELDLLDSLIAEQPTLTGEVVE